MTSEAFLFNSFHDLILSLFIYTVEDIKSRSQDKHVNMLKLQLTLIWLNELFISTQPLPFSSKQVISAFSACRSLFFVL